MSQSRRQLVIQTLERYIYENKEVVNDDYLNLLNHLKQDETQNKDQSSL